MADMGGADDKVEVICPGINRIFARDFRLQSQFHAEEQLYLICILFF